MEHLTGTMVMVHPQLTSDPVSRQGQIGIVTHADLQSDTVEVGFGSRPLGLYTSNALLVLKSHDQLYMDLLTNVKALDMADFKLLLRVNMLQETGGPAQLKQAMEMLATSPKALTFATQPLDESLEIALSKSHSQASTYSR